MTPLRLTVKTEDATLIQAINAIKNDDLTVSAYTTDAIPSIAETAYTIAVTITSAVAAGSILELIKKYIVNKGPEKTTINNINVENNSAPVFIEINNYIQKQQIDEKNGEKDKGKFEVIESGNFKYYGKKID